MKTESAQVPENLADTLRLAEASFRHAFLTSGRKLQLLERCHREAVALGLAVPDAAT